MRILRDVSGRDLVRALNVCGCRFTRQTGCRIQLTRVADDGHEHYVTVPDHDAVRAGTLLRINTAVAHRLARPVDDIVDRLS